MLGASLSCRRPGKAPLTAEPDILDPATRLGDGCK
jgi:hypothetical protein